MGRLRNNRVAGPDAIPAEYWKTVVEEDGILMELTELVDYGRRDK